jgi:hypothetical protein
METFLGLIFSNRLPIKNQFNEVPIKYNGSPFSFNRIPFDLTRVLLYKISKFSLISENEILMLSNKSFLSGAIL